MAFVSPVDKFQITYQPKSVGKMADFETLALCISLISSQICIYFWKDLVTGYYLYLVTIPIPNCYQFLNWSYFLHLVAMGLMSHEIRVYGIWDWYSFREGSY